ncbi:MAG: DNA topoisomerase III [Rhodocyclaceae bacterium]|nr:DNA topoisomerase III [Rhodocyclaceae bacterium]
MSKSLIIAEKPSVASDIAKALGGFTKHADYFESDDYVLSSAVGHLVEIAMPEEEEVKRGKWTFAHLPAIPSYFALRPIEKTEARLKVLLKLIKRKDVGALINACDAGREGELIFRYIYQYAKAKQPIKRLWLQSMTQSSIRDGFKTLASGESMQGLADAAVCRSESDWLVGINGTRAMTAFNSKSGGFQLTTVGRVQTPTLAIMVEREERIKAFKPRDYWEVHASFSASGGDYAARWFNEQHHNPESDEHLKAERLWDEKRARALVTKCLGKMGLVEEASKPTTQASPLLFDLTSLQREANSRFGFSAKTTLGLAQALYEKHKVLTYPRTDARALPEDYLPTVKQTLEMLKSGEYNVAAKKILDGGWVKPNKRIFDNSKISDHFAIIPTLQEPKSLNEIEQKLYDFVVKRFLAVFYPSAEFMQTTRITRVEGEAFKSEGKVLVNPGWLAVYGRDADEDGAASHLAAVKPGEMVKTEAVEVKANATKPPPRYTEATLLSAMEGAGKAIDDEELRAAMKEKGLGTPATRAAIIEGLLYEKYIHREGRDLIPTAKASSLMIALHGLGIPELYSPELTAEWEQKLALMQKGEMSRAKFMEEIADMTEHIVGQAKNFEHDTIPGDFGALAVACPKCGGEVHENYKKFACVECDFGFWKILAGRQLEAVEAEALIQTREIGPLEGFRSRQGRAFSANLVLNKENVIEFSWGDGVADDEEIDFSAQEPLGHCPKCNANVYETPNAYTCQKATGPAKTCDFRSGRTILKRVIEREEMIELLQKGKTPLLEKFISKKGRPFAAFLVKQPDGKIGFEFEERDPKMAKGKATAARSPVGALRILGNHPEDGAPISVYSGRYGPYVKYGDINATIPDKDEVDSITLEEALALIGEKTGGGVVKAAKVAKVAKVVKRSAKPRPTKALAKRRAT